MEYISYYEENGVNDYHRENGRIQKTKTEKPDRNARILKNSREKKWNCFSVYIRCTPHQVHKEKITLKINSKLKFVAEKALSEL